MVLNAWMRFTERLPLPQRLQQGRRNKVFVIGIDSHKDTLAACVVDHLGAPIEYRSIANTPEGHRELVDWGQAWHPVKVAVEGSGTLGRPVAVAALRAGLDVREVPPQLTAQVRRRGRTQTKSDRVDALVIAPGRHPGRPDMVGRHRRPACFGLIPLRAGTGPPPRRPTACMPIWANSVLATSRTFAG